MSAPSEALFSRVNDIVTKKRNRLLPLSIKQLAILKSGDAAPDDGDIVDVAKSFEMISLEERETRQGSKKRPVDVMDIYEEVL
jgi:hypothetical protein